MTSIKQPEDVLEFHENYMQDHYEKGEDIELQMYAMKNNSLFTVPIADRETMRKVISIVNTDEGGVDWACIMFTGYYKQVSEDEANSHKHGDLADDEEAQEVHSIQIYHPEKRIVRYYTKEFEEIKTINDQKHDLEGQLVI